MSLALAIDAYLDTTGMSEDDVKLELACIAYREQRLTFNQAKKFAEVSASELIKILGCRGIDLYFDEDDVLNDIQIAEELDKSL